MSLQKNRTGGFTLIELLIVIAVILMLMAMLLPMINYIKARAKVNQTKTTITNLQMGTERYKSNFGEYPPSSSSELGLSLGLNEGIECLALCLTSRDRGGPFFHHTESDLVNTDGDSGTNPTNSLLGVTGGTVEYFEIKDAWDRPLIYIRATNYASGGGQYLPSEGGNAFTATTGVGRTGTANPLTFQIRSLGPDGQIDTDDDVDNWGGAN